MEMIMKKALAKKNGKKGFTLVEVIVVLVILAILAAIAIPALTGYIDKANKRALVTEARTVGVALQTIASDAYGDGYTITETGVVGTANITSNPARPTTGDLSLTYNAYIEKLTGSAVTGTLDGIYITGTKVTGFKYTKDGKIVTYASGKYSVA